MKNTFGWKSVLAVVIALVALVGASSIASADRGKPAPGRGRQPVTLAGVISAIDTDEDGSTLTLQRPGKSDVQVLVTAETRVVPTGATPAIGDTARVVGGKPENEGDPIVATVLNLSHARAPQGPKPKAELRVCGTIAALPDDIHAGTWKITVANVGEYDLVVNADTKITPPDATPAVGGPVCAKAHQVDADWVAQEIHLQQQAKPGERKQEHRALVIRGTVAEPLPDERTGEWTLVVAIEGADEQNIGVTPDTQIQGELAVGAKVVVVARKVTDADGNENLVAQAINVVERREAPKPKANVRLKGVVKDPGETAWTITLEDGTDVVLGITGDTMIVGLAEGEDATGRKVEAHAIRAEDGSLVARLLRLERD